MSFYDEKSHLVLQQTFSHLDQKQITNWKPERGQIPHQGTTEELFIWIIELG